MEMNKKLTLAALALTLLLPGCGKKEKKSEPKKTVALSTKEEIPVLKEEIEEFIDDGNIQEFAFVDDEFAKQDTATKPLAMADEEEYSDYESEEEYSDDATTSDEINWASDEEEETPTEEEAKNAYSFKTVLFDLNKNNIRKDQSAVVTNDVEVAKKAAAEGKKLVIGGHCCQLGSPSYNLSLSERRANTLKKEMVKNGIPAENIKAIGYGQEMPVVYSDSTDKKSLIKALEPNRRAEVAIN